jgi:hypothetical protein
MKKYCNHRLAVSKKFKNGRRCVKCQKEFRVFRGLLYPPKASKDRV